MTERLNKGQQNVVQSERLTRGCIIFRFVSEWRKSDTVHIFNSRPCHETHYLPFTSRVLKQGKTRQRQRERIKPYISHRLFTSEAHDSMRVLLLDALLEHGIARISEHCFGFHLYRNFLCSPPRAREDPSGRRVFHTWERTTKGICVHGDSARPVWNSWIWANFPSHVCATSRALITLDHVSRLSHDTRVYPFHLTPYCIYLLTFSVDLSSVAFGRRWINRIPRWVIYAKCILYVYSRYLSQQKN